VRFGEGRVLQRGHVPAKGSTFERSASEKIVSRETLKDSPLEGVFLLERSFKLACVRGWDWVCVCEWVGVGISVGLWLWLVLPVVGVMYEDVLGLFRRSDGSWDENSGRPHENAHIVVWHIDKSGW
jgi:hypothetical protein